MFDNLDKGKAPVVLALASTNESKVQACREAWERFSAGEPVELKTVAADSSVGSQPHTDLETFLGVLSRLDLVKKAVPEADIWVAIEGGLEAIHSELFVFGWVASATRDSMSTARTASFPLPRDAVAVVSQGRELGDATDQVFGTNASGRRGGIVSILTRGLVTRAILYREAIILSLAGLVPPSQNDDGRGWFGFGTRPF